VCVKLRTRVRIAANLQWRSRSHSPHPSRQLMSDGVEPPHSHLHQHTVLVCAAGTTDVQIYIHLHINPDAISGIGTLGCCFFSTLVHAHHNDCCQLTACTP
jgi:hypothetical protein